MGSLDKRKLVFTLTHCYEDTDENDEVKFLGAYSTKSKALAAIKRYAMLPGFNKYPDDCFFVDKYEIDQDYGWKEGFASSIEVDEDFKTLTEIFNTWFKMEKTSEESWEDPIYYTALCKVFDFVYSSQNALELAQNIERIFTSEAPEICITYDDCCNISKSILTALKRHM